MGNWCHCVVSYIDMVGTKRNAAVSDGVASRMMRKMQALVRSAPLRAHAQTYLWNDSALLLAFVDERLTQAASILREVDALKKQIDSICPSYAISVAGKAFPDLDPPPSFVRQVSRESRVVTIQASSWAMANCFLIEDRLGRKHKKPWSVDSRITRHIKTSQSFLDKKMPLLPSNRPRIIRLYDGYLW